MLPKMILFDYGQTLVHEISWNPLAGAEALMDCARTNPAQVTPAQLSDLLERIKGDILQEFGAESRSRQPMEIPFSAMLNYAALDLGLTFSLPGEELEWRFWQAAVPAEPAEHIDLLLDALDRRDIPIGVVSNLMYRGSILERRLAEYLPGRKFAFVLSTCDFVYRKPRREIFNLALARAGVDAREALFCGDNLRCDIRGAHEAGIPSVWYTRYVKHRPELEVPETAVEISDWQELVRLCAQ